MTSSFIFATLFTWFVLPNGEPVKLFLDHKIDAVQCVEMVESFVNANEPMEATLNPGPNFPAQTILIHPRNLVCEPFVES